MTDTQIEARFLKSKPGPKPIKAADVEVIDPKFDQDKIGTALQAVRTEGTEQALAVTQHESAVRAVALQMGYQLPADCTDPDLIQRDISANMRRSVEACLEVGKGLRVLKEACAHGNFMARLDVLGIDDAVAQKFMQAARKFSNTSTSRHLTQAVKNQSQLFELLILDDAQIEELELTGQTGELSLDDVATMSVKELRQAVRAAKIKSEDDKQLIADKDSHINTLNTKLKRIDNAEPEEHLALVLSETTTRAHTALAYVRGDLNLAFSKLAGFEKGGANSHRHLMAGWLADLEREIAILRADYFLPQAAITPGTGA